MSASWDTANYHYFLGWTVASKSFYKYGIIAGANTFFNPLCDYFNYLTYHFSPYLGAFCQSLFFTSVLFLIYQISLKILVCENAVFTQILALAACIIAGTTTNGVHLDGFYNDIPPAMFILLSLFMSIIILQSSKKAGFIFTAGLLAGIAVGLKLTSAPYAVSLWLGLACLAKPKVKTMFWLTVGMLFGYFLCEAPFWLLRWHEYKNPIFPMANNIFHSPYFSKQWYSLHNWQWHQLEFYLTLPFQWLYSGHFARQANMRDSRILMGFLGVLAILLAWSKGSKNAARPEVKLLLITYLVSWILWLVIFRVYRYLIILNFISGILLLLGLMEFKLITWQKKFRTMMTAVIMGLFFLSTTTYFLNSNRPWSSPFVTVRFPFKIQQGQLVLIADRRLSYLIPFIVKKHAIVANISTQPWSSKTKWPLLPNCKGMKDSHPPKLPNIENILILQYQSKDPSLNNKFLSSLTKGYTLVCGNVKNNFLLKPKLCRYQRNDV
jgi:hypothetical protein